VVADAWATCRRRTSRSRSSMRGTTVVRAVRALVLVLEHESESASAIPVAEKAGAGGWPSWTGYVMDRHGAASGTGKKTWLSPLCPASGGLYRAEEQLRQCQPSACNRHSSREVLASYRSRHRRRPRLAQGGCAAARSPLEIVELRTSEIDSRFSKDESVFQLAETSTRCMGDTVKEQREGWPWWWCLCLCKFGVHEDDGGRRSDWRCTKLSNISRSSGLDRATRQRQQDSHV
jgi:hypothetical protein